MLEEDQHEGKKMKSHLSDSSISVKVGDAFSYKKDRPVLMEGAGVSVRMMKETVDIEAPWYVQKSVASSEFKQGKPTDAIAAYYPCKRVTGSRTPPAMLYGFSEVLNAVSTGKLHTGQED